MSHPSPLERPRRPRWVTLLGLLGVAVLIFSTVGASWMLRSDQRNPGHVEPIPGVADPSKAVFCVGHVDVEGGLTYPYPLRPGRVTKVFVKEGQSVSADEPLYALDDTWSRFELQRAEIDLRDAELQLEEARARATEALDDHKHSVGQATKARDAARYDLEAASQLAEHQKRLVGRAAGVNEDVVAATDKQLKRLELVLAAAEDNLKQLQAKKPTIEATSQRAIKRAAQAVEEKKVVTDEARKAVDEYQVKAPLAGQVLRLSLQPGDLLAEKPQSPPLIFCPSTPRIVRAEVEQEWVNRVVEGQIATIRDETNGSGPVWTGKVARLGDWMARRRSILPDPGAFVDVRTLECIVAIDEGQPPLRIGQRVRVTLSNPQS